MDKKQGRGPLRGCLVTKGVDQRQAIHAEQWKRSCACGLPVRTGRNPGAQFV